MRPRSAWWFVALVLALAACAEEEVLVNPPGSASLLGSRWVVGGFSLDDAGGALPPGVRLTLDFDEAGGVGGSAGCNSYFGTVRLSAGGLRITGIGSTEMACAPEVMERESRFLAALGRVTAFRLEAERLTLTADDGTATIDLVPFVPEADRPLAGTVWRLTTLIDGETASSVVAGAVATLQVDDLAGRISGNSGCNSFFGDATFAGGEVSVGAIGATKMACEPALMDQEGFVFGVLEAATTWEIEGAVLRLATADGRALEFAAE